MKLTKKTLSLLLSLLLVLGAVGTGFMSASAELPTVTLAGDANCDGQVDMADCVLISQSLANPNKYGLYGSDPSHLTEQGMYNADVESNIKGVTAGDALTIQKYLLGIISSFDIQGTGASVTPPVFDENIGISFSFTDENGSNKVNLASGQGGTIAVNVNIDAGSNPVSALDVQFAVTSGIKISEIYQDSKAFRGETVSSNLEELRAGYLTLDGDSPVTAQNGKAAFLIDVEVPAGTPDGVYNVNFSSHRKIFRDNTAFNYTVTTVPLEIVVGNIPVEISNYAQLKAFADEVNSGNTAACAILTADIDASASDPGKPGYDPSNAWTPIGNDSNKYTGVFDGDGHVITGLTYNSSADYAGLFGYISGVKEGDEIVGGIVKNVGIEDGNITGTWDAGGVAGFNYGGSVTNCYNTGDVTAVGTGAKAGGVVGENTNGGTVSNCYNTGDVSGADIVGGVVGLSVFECSVTKCYNTGNVSGADEVGGVVGLNTQSCSVTNCYNTGDVTADGTSGKVGGVAGVVTISSSVTNCYNTGDVSGAGSVGGVSGHIKNSTVTNCYNTGAVSGYDKVGGVVGKDYGDSEIANCYYDSSVATGIPAIGEGNGTNVTGLTTAQMTGDDALSDSNMKFVFSSSEENPWLTKADGAEEGGEYYWFYPHLKGFNLKADGTPETDTRKILPSDWPAKTEVTVKLSSEASYTYNGCSQGPAVTSVIIGDSSAPAGMTVNYQKYENGQWKDLPGAPSADSGNYKMAIRSDDGTIETKYFKILEASVDYTVSYCKKVDSSWSTEPVTPVDAGEYKAVITFLKAVDSGEGVTYNPDESHAPIEKGFTIKPKAVTVKAASQEFTYDGTAHSNDGYEVTGLVGDDAIIAVVTGSIKYPSESPVTNKITSYVFTAGTPGNYNVTTVNGSLTMAGASKSITITSASQAWTYDGQSHSNSSVTVTSGELFAGDVLVAEATGSATNVSDTAEGNNTIAPGYKIMHGDEDVTANYTITAVNGTLTINPASVTLTANSRNTDVYDGTEKTVTGFKSSVDGLTFNGVNASGSGTNAGSYDVTFTGVTIGVTRDTTGNYIVTATENGTLTISPAPVTLTADSDIKTYDGTEKTVTGFASSVDGLTFNGVNASGSGKDYGSYDVTFTGVTIGVTRDTTGNYVVTATENGTLTITKAKATVTITGHNNVTPYDGEEHTVSGYDVQISNPVYESSDFEFTGIAEGKRSETGRTYMGLSKDQFVNKNANFDVTFVIVADGYQEIVSVNVEVEITGNSAAADCDGSEHSVTGFTAKASNPLYDVENDIEFSGTAEAKRTEPGNEYMNLSVSQFANKNQNFNVTFVIADDGKLTVNPVIRFVNEDGSELQSGAVAYGETPEYTGETPAKDSDGWYTYDFNKWTPEITEANGNATYTATFTPVQIKYTARFVNEAGETIKEEKFTVETVNLDEPAVPEKTGYEGKWTEYTLTASDIQIQPVYTPIEYTAKFVNEAGETVREVKFTVETEKLDEPAVPEKTNYTGEWEDYTIGAGDMTIRPVYTLAGETKVDCVNYGGSVKLGYKQTQQYTFDAEYLPEGASVHIFINGEDKGEGTTYKVKEPTESYTVQAKVLDKDGNVITESDLINVKVKNSLCAKIWYFLMKIFSALVGTLGNIVIK